MLSKSELKQLELFDAIIDRLLKIEKDIDILKALAAATGEIALQDSILLWNPTSGNINVQE